jgi:hypothetical protein
MSLHAWSADAPLQGVSALDVRNWTVRTLIDDASVGAVHQLLIDQQAAPRYLDLALEGERCVLVPIGQARADRTRQIVWLPGLAAYQLEAIPTFNHGPLTRGEEVRMLNAYAAALAGATSRYGYRVQSARRRRPPAAHDPDRLVPLSAHPEWNLALGEADPRGWPVIDRSGLVRGTIRDLLADLAIRRVRYAVAELETTAGATRSVLVPVEFLQLDAGAAQTMLPVFNDALLAALPDFMEAAPDRASESAILELFGQALAEEDFYAHPRFDATSFFGTA